MQPSILPQTQETPPKFKKSRRFWLTLSLLTTAVIIAGLAVYLFHFRNTNPNKIKYHKSDSYSLTLTGKSGGSGTVFQKPIEFKVSYKTTTSVVLVHDIDKTNLVAYIAAGVTPLATPLFARDLQSYNQVL